VEFQYPNLLHLLVPQFIDPVLLPTVAPTKLTLLPLELLRLLTVLLLTQLVPLLPLLAIVLPVLLGLPRLRNFHLKRDFILLRYSYLTFLLKL